MADRTIYIMGNWKMNLHVGDSSLFVHKLASSVKSHRAIEVVLFPTMLALQSLSLQVNHRQFKLGAQNFYWRDHGAFTGEVSASQLRGLAKYALVGHSERRHVFHEHGREIGRKVQAAVRNGIRPVLCVGETASERAYGETADILHDQLVAGLANVTSEDMAEIIIAYEPVWAIGTGDNATPKDTRSAVQAIRMQLRHLFGTTVANATPVLYGGSVSIDNAASYLAVDGIDGLLIGGASLDSRQFGAIVEAAYKQGRTTKK